MWRSSDIDNINDFVLWEFLLPIWTSFKDINRSHRCGSTCSLSHWHSVQSTQTDTTGQYWYSARQSEFRVLVHGPAVCCPRPDELRRLSVQMRAWILWVGFVPWRCNPQIVVLCQALCDWISRHGWRAVCACVCRCVSDVRVWVCMTRRKKTLTLEFHLLLLFPFWGLNVFFLFFFFSEI